MRVSVIRGIRRVASLVRRSAAARLLDSRLAERARKRLIAISAGDVVEVVAALERAGIRFWIFGGWGIDALIGGQIRRHRDLDILVDRATDDFARARTVLARLGMDIVDEKPGGPLFPAAPHGPTFVAVTVHDGSHRVVELLATDVAAIREVDTSDTGRSASFVVGSIGERAVPCVSARMQLALHEGYEPQRVDREDVTRLREHFGSDGRVVHR
jgi:lincosamide nucleotidyltransferase A/C/D/E